MPEKDSAHSTDSKTGKVFNKKVIVDPMKEARIGPSYRLHYVDAAHHNIIHY